MAVFQELEAKFGDKVEVTGEGTPETTDYLEVISMVMMAILVMAIMMVVISGPRNDGLPGVDSTFACVL